MERGTRREGECGSNGLFFSLGLAFIHWLWSIPVLIRNRQLDMFCFFGNAQGRRGISHRVLQVSRHPSQLASNARGLSFCRGF